MHSPHSIHALRNTRTHIVVTAGAGHSKLYLHCTVLPPDEFSGNQLPLPTYFESVITK